MPSDKHLGPLWRRYYNVYDTDGVLLARAFSEETAARIVEAVNASAPTIRQRIKRMLDDIQGEPVAAGAPSGSSVFCSAQPPAGSSVTRIEHRPDCASQSPPKEDPPPFIPPRCDCGTERLLRKQSSSAPSPDAGDGPSDEELKALVCGPFATLDASKPITAPMLDRAIIDGYRALFTAGRASRDGTITGLIEELAKTRATLESELDKLRQLVCDFQAAAGITIGNDGDPARVTPEHVAGHVAALESELVALKGRLYRVRLELLIRRLAERRAELLARCVCERDQVSHDRFYERAMRAERRLKRFRAIPPELRPGEKEDVTVKP